jgi:hypothetical protein
MFYKCKDPNEYFDMEISIVRDEEDETLINETISTRSCRLDEESMCYVVELSHPVILEAEGVYDLLVKVISPTGDEGIVTFYNRDDEEEVNT